MPFTGAHSCQLWQEPSCRKANILIPISWAFLSMGHSGTLVTQAYAVCYTAKKCFGHGECPELCRGALSLLARAAGKWHSRCLMYTPNINSKLNAEREPSCTSPQHLCQELFTHRRGWDLLTTSSTANWQPFKGTSNNEIRHSHEKTRFSFSEWNALIFNTLISSQITGLGITGLGITGLGITGLGITGLGITGWWSWNQLSNQPYRDKRKQRMRSARF